MFPRASVLRILMMLACGTLVAASVTPSPSRQTAARDWRALHREAVVIDGHNDILARAVRGSDITLRTRIGHSDLPRFSEGGMDAQFFSIWVPSDRAARPSDAYAYARTCIDTLTAISARAPDRFRIARSSADIRSASRDAALACIIAFEGASPLDASPSRLREFHRLGVRCIAPTWTVSMPWASSSRDEAEGMRSPGLTAHGRTLIRVMDSLGVLIDVSHLGDSAIAELLATSVNPVIATHSGCRALRNHHRNLTDAQIRAIAARGGVVMVNMYPPYLRQPPKHWARSTASANDAVLKLGLPKAGFPEALLARYDSTVARARRNGLATILDVVDHVEHVMRTGGTGAAGLGSDFDGIDHGPVGLPDVTHFPLLTRELRRRGWSDDVIRQVLGGNALRLFTRVCG